MIDISRGLLILHGKEEEIKEFRVWFMTPFGLIEDREAAVSRCLGSELDPSLSIRPVSVAIAQTTYEVCGA